jgi:hypothetical protein
MLQVIVTVQLTGQLPVYNSDFKRCSHEIQTKGELADSLRLMGVVDRSYEVQGAKVIEYYEMSTTSFLGFAGDTTQFDLRKLPYLSRTPMMRRFVRQFGPEVAHDIRQGEFVEGMDMKDVVELHGWPKKRIRENGDRVWRYPDFELRFNKKELVAVTKNPKGS